MRRRLTPLVVLMAISVELYRDGLIAPLAYGIRRWARARPDRFYEPDRVG